jgi:putative DNA-invertase from lambdoid prophage Rac
MNTPPTAALYLRVSTSEQTVENQLPDLQRLVEARGLRVVETFSENVSAVKQRPAFDALMKAAHRGRIKILLVWSLDRLHRSMVGAIQAVLELDRLGVQVVSVREPWLDTSGPVRSLLVAIFGWVAEQERARISDRTKAGLERARRRGVRLGRREVPFDLERALALRASGASFRAVASELGVSVGKVHAALKVVQQTP